MMNLRALHGGATTTKPKGDTMARRKTKQGTTSEASPAPAKPAATNLTNTVPLSDIEPDAAFHMPETGHDGVVVYHGPGGSTVIVRKVEVKHSVRKVKARKGSTEEVERDVVQVVETPARTQWSSGAMVVPGAMPQAMREARLEAARREAGEVAAAAPSDDETGKPAAAPARAKGPGRAPRSNGTDQETRMRQLVASRTRVDFQHKDSGWPITFVVAGRMIGEEAPVFAGLKLVERKASGKGHSFRFTAKTPAGFARLLDFMVERNGASSEYYFLLATVARFTTIRVQRREDGKHVVEGKAA